MENYDPDILNIPAYQRQKSLQSKARKKSIPPPKSINNIRSTTPRSYSANQTFTDIPLYNSPPLIEENNFLPEENHLKTMRKCGTCEGYFEKIEVAIIKVYSPLRIGDRIIMETADGLFEQTLISMQIDRKDIKIARSGAEIGIKVLMQPQVSTTVYKVIN